MKKIILFIFLMVIPVMGKSVYVANEPVVKTTANQDLVNGDIYEASKGFDALADDGIFIYSLFTGSRYEKLTLNTVVSGSAYVSLYVTPTLTNDGVSVASINENLTSTNTAATSIYHTSVVTNAEYGTNLFTRIVASGSINTDYNKILNKNSTYIIVISNVSGGAIDGNITSRWVSKDNIE